MATQDKIQQAKTAYNDERYGEAFRLSELLAEQGIAEFQNMLGLCYSDGLGVEKNEVLAVRWYKKATDQGLAAAQVNLGICYTLGEGGEKNEALAVEWYKKAIEQGSAPAQYNLGACYVLAKGVEQDFKKAYELFSNIEGDDEIKHSGLTGLRKHIFEKINKQARLQYAFSSAVSFEQLGTVLDSIHENLKEIGDVREANQSGAPYQVLSR